jgi:glycosyltransferase involved in cell wall biosynthesis
MKIAVWHNLLTGGAKRALHMHVKGLHERGYQINVYTTTTSDRDYLPLGPYAASEQRLPLPPIQPAGKTPSWIPRNFVSEIAESRIARLKQLKQHAVECSRIIAADQCDVLFANSCHYTYNSPIGTSVDLPSISYLQEPYRPFYEASPRLPWLLPDSATAHPRNPLKRLAERSRELHNNHSIRLQATEELNWARQFDRILCNSQFSRESILRAYNLESKVCYLGIDSEVFKPTNEAKSPFVIGVGSMHYTKRIQAAIQAIAAIPAAIRPKLLWYGNFSDAWYKDHICNLALQHGVHFEEKTLVPDSELRSAMSQAACFLYTSHLEPFGLTPLEANACGTAVVAIGEGGVRETIIPGVNGFLSIDNNPQELGELVARCTESLDFAKDMGSQARAHVIKNWSVKHAIDRVEQHILEVASQ